MTTDKHPEPALPAPGPRFSAPAGQPCPNCGAPWSHDSQTVTMSNKVEARFRYWRCGRSLAVTIYEEHESVGMRGACEYVAALRNELERRGSEPDFGERPRRCGCGHTLVQHGPAVASYTPAGTRLPCTECGCDEYNPESPLQDGATPIGTPDDSMTPEDLRQAAINAVRERDEALKAAKYASDTGVRDRLARRKAEAERDRYRAVVDLARAYIENASIAPDPNPDHCDRCRLAAALEALDA